MIASVDQLDPWGFAPADPPRLRSRGPNAPLRSGGRARGAPSTLCGSRKRVQILVSGRITGYGVAASVESPFGSPAQIEVAASSATRYDRLVSHPIHSCDSQRIARTGRRLLFLLTVCLTGAACSEDPVTTPDSG